MESLLVSFLLYHSNQTRKREQARRTGRHFGGGRKNSRGRRLVFSIPGHSIALPALVKRGANARDLRRPSMQAAGYRSCSSARVLVCREESEAAENDDDEADVISSSSLVRSLARSLARRRPFFTSTLASRFLSFSHNVVLSLFSFWFSRFSLLLLSLAGPPLPTAPEASARWRLSPTQSR